MKRVWARSLLIGVVLTAALGIGFPLRAAQAQATAGSTQPAAAASASQAQSPQKDQQEQDSDEVYLKSPSVAWLGRKLGIGTDRASVLSDVGNFVLLALGIAWALVKILPKTIRERNTAIQKHLVDARTATEEARARLSGVEERLGKLDGEIAAMRAHAEQDSLAAEQSIKASLEDEQKKILAAAEQEIAAATGHAQKQLQSYAAGLAIEQAARKLVVTAETDRLLVQGFAQRLAGDTSKKGQN